MKKDPLFNKVKLTARQKKHLQSVLKEVYEDDPKINPEVKKGMLSWAKGITVRIVDLFDRKKEVNDTYEFFKPYYDLVGLKLTKKDAESIRYNVTTLAKKLRQIADNREIDNG
jgi:hypothetical protein